MEKDSTHEQIRRSMLDSSVLSAPIIAEIFANTPDTFLDELVRRVLVQIMTRYEVRTVYNLVRGLEQKQVMLLPQRASMTVETAREVCKMYMISTFEKPASSITEDEDTAWQAGFSLRGDHSLAYLDPVRQKLAAGGAVLTYAMARGHDVSMLVHYYYGQWNKLS